MVVGFVQLGRPIIEKKACQLICGKYLIFLRLKNTLVNVSLSITSMTTFAVFGFGILKLNVSSHFGFKFF